MFYELLEDGTIGRTTPSEKVAKSLGLTLQTDKDIVNCYNGKRYFKGQEPKEPAPTKEELVQQRIVELKAKLIETDYICIKIAEGAATHAEYAEKIAQRQSWRAEINRLEQENEQTNGVIVDNSN